MSFEPSISELVQLACSACDGATQACGEHDELTRDISSLHKVLTKLQREALDHASYVNQAETERKQELAEHVAGCEGLLRVMNSVLAKYNGLSPEKKQEKKLWQKIKFKNGETKEMADIRKEFSAHTSAILLSLNLCSLDSLGKVEARLGRVERQSSEQGHQMKGIRRSLQWATASLATNSGEGSTWTSYTNDEESFWRELRRELVKEGYHSSAIKKHKRLIKAYVEELGNRGVFDDFENGEPNYIHAPSIGTRPANPPTPDPASASLTLEHNPNNPTDHSEATSMPNSVAPRKPSSMPIPSVQIEEVLDEEFMHHPRHGQDSHWVLDEIIPLEAGRTLCPDEGPSAILNPQIVIEAPLVSRSDSGVGMCEDREHKQTSKRPIISNPNPTNPSDPREDSEYFAPVFLDDAVDETHGTATMLNNHLPGIQATIETDQNALHSTATSLESRANVPDSSEAKSPILTSAARSSHRRKSSTPKQVRFAVEDNVSTTATVSSPINHPNKERGFIFFREFRDFQAYQELDESYQALFDEQTASPKSPSQNIDTPAPPTSNFITHSPYTPPATMWDLQYYRIPASYFHKFWHPQRVPIYLHGNVFDGISLVNWVHNWTAYKFGDYSFEMNTARRFGKTVIKLGSALSDIERAKPEVKARLPKDLYDQSGVLWAELENVLNDIMALASARIERKGKENTERLEVEFVMRLCHEIIAGTKFYRTIEGWLNRTEEWCKVVRFDERFIMLWELWTT